MGWLSRIFAAPKQAATKVVRVIRAGYDAARTTEENRKHWANADALSANAALSPAVRATLRNRARYEVANNCYAAGLVRTVANDLIGTGPVLQINAPDGHDAGPIEKAWRKWAKSVKLARKLRCMRQCLSRDGEAFAIMFMNSAIDGPIQLDIRLVEAEQCSTPGLIRPNAVDGITFDDHGNPAEYHFLKTHPGDGAWSMEVEPIEAKYVIHWFRLERPGQRRGVSIIAPALPLFSTMRRMTLAVLGTAEIQARRTGVLTTPAPANEEADGGSEPFDEIETAQYDFVTVPEGSEFNSFKPEQPIATYGEFKHEIIDEAARCENVPSNVARGNSSSYNYASGRLDGQMFGRAQHVDHSEVEEEVLDRLYAKFVDEAILAGLIPDGFPPLSECEHEWFWDGKEHVDPAKEANAQATRLANYTTTYAEEFAKQGKDWEKQLRQIKREQELIRSLGLTPVDAARALEANAADAAEPDEPALVPAGPRQLVKGGRNG